jgi:uncharacterized protein (TIGR02099 family)
LLAGYFAFALLLLALRYGVLPQIENYRGDIEASLSRAARLPVRLGGIEAGWSGLRPQLRIHGVQVQDAQGRPALGFDEVEAELSWASLWHLEPRLARIELVTPELDIRRDREGRLFIAGLEVPQETSEEDFSDWLLKQERVVVREAQVRWSDALRDAPTLSLTHLNFELRNSGSRHSFGFTAEPPRELAARLEIRGDFRGRDLDVLEAWKGEAYAELDYADLAAWRTWVDYPVELPRGTGGLRMWLDFANKSLTGLTADIRLADVELRVAPDLPMLELTKLEGRLAGKRQPDGFQAEAKKLTLTTRSGVAIPPTDFNLRFQAAAANRPAQGDFETSGLDLGVLSNLAAHLPFDPLTRQRLADYAPRGRVNQLRFSWGGEPGHLERWKIKGSFDELGLMARDGLPGFHGLAGSIEGDQQGGRLTLDSQKAEMELPGVFAEPRLALDGFGAQATWRASERGIDIQLAKATFQNADAAGEASGTYRLSPQGPGDIDLSARLSRGSGDAVWRYMPLTVGKDVRDWLRTALVGGHTDDVVLRLKGDLSRFPFRDSKDEIFQVKGRFREATLRYAERWPAIDNIAGELLFEGARMLITAHSGSILGVGIGPVTAEIADLEVMDEILQVQGRASGATAGFLQYIEASPVGERIDHFTEDMQATGNGELNLKMQLPLRRMDASKIEGRYRFAGNQLTVDPDLPPLTDVNGELQFTASRLDAHKIRASLFGAPMTVDVATLGDGNVSVKAAGTLTSRGLRQQYAHPLLDHLTGAAPWTGTVRVKKKNPEVRIETNLVGMASSLPPPFNKTTQDSLPLVFERKPTGSGTDQLAVQFGDAAKLNLLRRHDGTTMQIERGQVAIGTALPKLPERGIAVGVRTQRLDLDTWKSLMSKPAAGKGEGSLAGLNRVDVQAEEVAAQGRTLHEVKLSASPAGETWKLRIDSREAAGNLDWNGSGPGRLSGHLNRLAIPEGVTEKAVDLDTSGEMPAVDLVIDHFLLRGKDFGQLKMQGGSGSDGFWSTRLSIRNEDATLEGEGRWRPSGTAPETQLSFKLDTRSIEKLLQRLGYPDAVRRGLASLEGTLTWRGIPFAIDWPSLGGRVKFEAGSGQFNKLEPGVGRLLGILSLQALPRRLILDFRDVFSEGFAFDGIAGEATITRGIIDTQNLVIAGPAARVAMSGSANLVSETQNLKVRVQPSIGDSVATGVLLAHPVTGVTTWVINKLFGNPLDQAFSFEYAVTGSWADPKVEKIAAPTPPAQQP